MKKLSEKSVSKNQQQFMGMVHGLQKGEIDPSDVSQDVKDAANSMKKKDVKDFASTKHKGLPTKVKKENMKEGIFDLFKKKNPNTDEAWFYKIADSGLDFLQKKYKTLKNYELSSLGPGDSKTFMAMAISDSKNDKSEELGWKVYFDKNNKITKVVPVGTASNYFVNKKQESMDKLFEQLFKEGGFPDRQVSADSFTEPGEDILDFDKNRNERIKKEIVKRLKEQNLLEFPQNWMQGRGNTNQHTAKKTAPRTYDNDEANFITKNSGQPDLEEHHEDYPDEILQMSVGDFLTKSKEKDEELYHSFEDIIDKYIGNDSPLDESAMGTIDVIAQEAPNFKKFVQDVFKEFKDLKKTKEAIEWLKSIYDNKTNESVVDESITISINSLPDLIPGGQFKNRELKNDIIDALNGIYKKYGIGRQLK